MTEENKGLLDSLTAFSATLVSIVHTRLQLLSTEIEEDRTRLFSLVLLLVAALFCIVIGLVLATILIVFMLWETHRLLALTSVASLFLLAGFVISWLAIQKIKTKPKLFSTSLQELVKDKGALESSE
jgi:uncharacterized membrane protein YqjE